MVAVRAVASERITQPGEGPDGLARHAIGDSGVIPLIGYDRFYEYAATPLLKSSRESRSGWSGFMRAWCPKDFVSPRG